MMRTGEAGVGDQNDIELMKPITIMCVCTACTPNTSLISLILIGDVENELNRIKQLVILIVTLAQPVEMYICKVLLFLCFHI